MSRRLVSVLTALLFAVALVLPVSVTSAAEEPVWHLVEVIDYPNQDSFAKASEHPSYDYKASYAPHNFTVTQTFVGKGDPDLRPPKVYGESLTVQAQTSTPPETISKGQTVSLELTIAATANTLSFFTFSGSIRAYFDAAEITPGGLTSRAVRFENDAKQSHFAVKAESGYASIAETVRATPRTGSKPGDRMALIIAGDGGGVTMGTKYVYEWAAPSDKPAQPQQPATPPPSPRPTTPAPPLDPKLEPCDARFGDLTGEVNVKQHGEDDDAYIFAELSTPLYHDTQIRTRPRSGAIISYTDMTTYVMGADSVIVLDCAFEYESKTRLVAGQVWLNLKRLVEDGSMEVEMSQAVAGIKGTTLILEDDGKRSTIKVLEGTVVFTAKDGQVLTVSGGEIASAANGKGGKVEKFSIADEMSHWDAHTRQMTEEILGGLAVQETGKKGSLPLNGLITLSALLVGGGLVAVLIRRKR